MIDTLADDPVTPKPTTLEGVLAQQANEAIKAGIDPKHATDMLGTMVRHIRANPTIAQQGYEAYSQGIDPGAIANHVWTMAQAPKEGVILRAGSMIRESILHAPTAISSGVKQTLSDLGPIATAMNTPMGQGRVSQVTPEQGKAGLRGAATLAATAAFPEISRAVSGGLAGAGVPRLVSTVGGLSTAGATAGAASNPSDPVASALAGAALAPIAHGTVKLGVGTARLAGSAASAVGGKVLDVAGRPMDSRPGVTIPFLKNPVGAIEGVSDRAARLNTPAMSKATIPAGDKPMAPVDVGGTEAVRLARGLKTSSPAAESVLRDALQPRAENAVNRVIQHGLETTGLTSRENGLGVVGDMVQQRLKTGNATYQPLFEQNSEPLTSHEYDRIAKTHSGQIALRRGMQLASDRGEKIGNVQVSGGTPPGFSPEQWSKVTEAMKARGEPVPDVPGGETQLAPTLRQAHFMKLGFDDLINSGAEPGEGGSGPNLRAGRIQLKNQLLAQMDKDVPEYGKVRKISADQADLVNGAKLGRNLFKMHPQEATKALAELPKDAQDVARRTGFDALAERIENGQNDIDKGLKIRDRQRMRLLFPDDESFAKFQEGLKQEAQMHATNQTLFGGSPTAEKLADMAGIAGVTLPDVLSAAHGRVLPLAIKAGRAMMTKGAKASTDALAAERAKLLVAGAGGDAAARAAALERMGITPPRLRVPSHTP